MSDLAKFLLGSEKLTSQLNYRKWSLDIKPAAELSNSWDAMIGEDEAVSESAEHKRNLRKREQKARGLITGSVSDLLKVELDELKGDEETKTTGTGEDAVTVTVRATLPLQFLVLKSRLSGLRTIHARDNPHKG